MPDTHHSASLKVTRTFTRTAEGILLRDVFTELARGEFAAARKVACLPGDELDHEVGERMIAAVGVRGIQLIGFAQQTTVDRQIVISRDSGGKAVNTLHYESYLSIGHTPNRVSPSGKALGSGPSIRGFGEIQRIKISLLIFQANAGA